MRSQFEQDDVQAIAAAVAEILRPLLPSNGNGKGEADVVFDKKGLSEYLKTSESTINKLVCSKQVPFFKLHPGQSGGVRFYKKKIDEWIVKRSIPAVNPVPGTLK